MDEFVRNKLTEWDLSEWIKIFEEHEINRKSLYLLNEQHIEKLIPKMGPMLIFKDRLKMLKEQNTANPETVDSSAQVCPSTSDTSDKGKRESDLQDESSKWQSPTKKQRLANKPGSDSEEKILSDVKNIMTGVHQKIPPQYNKLNNFLRKKIRDLETDKREVVGVFGKTGAGKSSLINAVIGVKNLLPSGHIRACTSVMIKVEANMQNSKYEANIEFITKKEWEDELWFSKYFLGDNADQESDQKEDGDRRDIVAKLSALYGEDWENKSPDDLMNDKYFKEIPEFLFPECPIPNEKNLTVKTAEELSAKLVRYTRSDPKDGEGKDVKRWYWPLVKCVTIKVPNNNLLKHVTLVDLPGNGDRNKSRDKMWKTVVGNCSTGWIVADRNRAASEPEAWEILKSASSFMGNGGQCQRIHFICTKSDIMEDSEDHSAANDRPSRLKSNEQAKKAVREEFSNQKEVKKHFSDESFKVFTVSSTQFLKKKCRDRNGTEIPKLQEFLQGLNDCHSETINYVSGARGILSLIQGASRRGGADIKTAVYTVLQQKMSDELDKVRKPMKETYQAFEKCLSEGVEKSKSSCEKVLKSVIHPPNTSGSGFHMTLKSIVDHNGIHKPKKGKQMNLNMKLSSCLTESIDEEFKKTFPNEGKCGPFNGVLNSFSLHTKMMKEKTEYKDVELQLIFLSTEEEQIKIKLNKIIREHKKTIYSSLTTTIETNMQKCYDEAKQIKGEGTLSKTRETMKKHVLGSKDVMFQKAKDVMLKQLDDLMNDILDDLEESMKESIELSLKTDGVSIPDVELELEMVNNHYKELQGSSDQEPLICAGLPSPAAAQLITN